MGLITCKECGKQISDRAAACPGCGSPIDRYGSAAIKAAFDKRIEQYKRAGYKDVERKENTATLVKAGASTWIYLLSVVVISFIIAFTAGPLLFVIVFLGGVMGVGVIFKDKNQVTITISNGKLIEKGNTIAK